MFGALRMAARPMARRVGTQRGMATAVAGESGKYANALLTLAKKEGDLDQVAQDLAQFSHEKRNNRTFAQLLSIPRAITKDGEKETLIASVSEAIGADNVSKDFFTLLMYKDDLDKLDDVARDYNTLLMEERKQVLGTITSAQALTPAQLKAATAKMQEHVKPGYTLTVETAVDPTILGGLVVSIGDQYQDLSVASFVTKLEGGLHDALAGSN